MIDFRFEILSLSDLDKVIKVEESSHQFPWSKNNFKDCLDNAYWNYVLVDSSAKSNILGHCIVMPGVEELHLLNITICPEYRRENIASRTLFAIEETGLSKGYLRVLLEVRRSNLPAIHLYEKIGYQFIGVRKSYYPSGLHGDNSREDALVMEKVLRR
jgi:ribosomal-protein-alanine N-acetyltransferase